jgi:tetratricopeptide (TPR) repeat protein
VSSYWFRKGLEHARAHPGQTALLALRKLYYAVHGTPIADNEDLRGLRRHLHLYSWLPVGMWLLAPLGLLGALAAASAAARELWLVRAYLWAQMLAVLPFFVVERFRVPWAPALAVFTAWSLAALWTRRRRPGRFTAAALALLVVCNLPLFGARDAPAFDLDYRIAYAYQRQGRIEAAMQAYRDAIARDPNAALARNALGTLLAERGENLDEAAALVRSALRLDPAHAPHFEESLALVELRRGRAAAAVAACDRGLAAAAAPALQAALRVRRAEALDAMGRPAEAAADLHRALALQPNGEVERRARALLAALGEEGQTRPGAP